MIGFQLVGRARTPVAWRSLLQDKVRLIASSLAVGFAVLIMFMELGFLNGLYDSQSGALRMLDADLVMVSRGLHILNTHDNFPRRRLEQAGGMPGVASVAPLYIEDRRSMLRNPESGARRVIRVIAFDPADRIFAAPDLARKAKALQAPLTILFDRSSRALYGRLRPGMAVELGPRAVTVAGTFALGPDYYYDGNLLASTETLLTLFPGQQRDRIALGLIRLDPGASPGRVLELLQADSAPDVKVLRKADIVAHERAKWRQATPAGYIFTMGVAVGFVIGVFICYQVLFTDIADRLPQFATLKAIGYHDRDLIRLVLGQALLLGLSGFLAALIAAFALYALLTGLTGIVTVLSPWRILLVLALTLAMCLVAGRLAVRKALAADPADLY